MTERRNSELEHQRALEDPEAVLLDLAKISHMEPKVMLWAMMKGLPIGRGEPGGEPFAYGLDGERTQKRGRENTLAVAAQNRSQDRKRAAYERLLTQAIHVTEFVGGADTVWERDAQPPDVDFESFDAWLVLDLYASRKFLSGYQAWSDAVSRLRDILQGLPEDVRWYEADTATQEKFEAGRKDMEELLAELKRIARGELA